MLFHIEKAFYIFFLFLNYQIISKTRHQELYEEGLEESVEFKRVDVRPYIMENHQPNNERILW